MPRRPRFEPRSALDCKGAAVSATLAFVSFVYLEFIPGR